MSETVDTPLVPNGNHWRYYVAVFVAGFACLGIEIIGPRVLSSIYGSSQLVWAASIVTTLGGLSVGGAIAGLRFGASSSRAVPALLALSGLYTLLIPWLSWLVADAIGVYHPVAIFSTTLSVFFVPAMCFGAVTPLCIDQVIRGSTHYPPRIIVGAAYAMGSTGGILGALFVAFVGLQGLGVADSVRVLAAIQLLPSLLLAVGHIRVVPIAAFGLLQFVEAADVWDSPHLLMHKEDTMYQTIRIYASRDHSMRYVTSGFACESAYNLVEQRAEAGYAARISALFFNGSPKSILVVGGAGNALSLEAQSKGMHVETIEIDGRMLDLAQQYCGELTGSVWIGDARAILKWAELATFDLLIVDAFTAPGIVPGHLLTAECMTQYLKHLNPDGTLVINFPGALQGPASKAVDVLVGTMYTAFTAVYVKPVLEGMQYHQTFQNLLVMASRGTVPELGIAVPKTFQIATDDKNPLDALMLLTHIREWTGVPVGRRGGWVLPR